MSFDKTKAMRNAERFLAQGKIRAAINEYKRIVESDPRDFTTLNMLGDLYSKTSDVKEAVSCFNQVAEHYGQQGFSKKAIAVYNKISRLSPDSMEISAKLAELYHSKGSVAEARSHYTALAEQYQRKGNKTEALSVLKQIAELDPNNSEIYLQIADIYWNEKQADEAASAFIEAGLRLSNKQEYEAAIKSFSRGLEIRPNDLIGLKGIVKAQIHLGYTDEAAQTLEKVLEKEPFNREVIFLLVDCYLDTNNPQEAERIVTQLVEREPANYAKLIDVANSYLKNNDLDSAARLLSMTSEHLLVGGQAKELEKWVNEILARKSEHVEALRLLVRIHSWQRDEPELKDALERLVDAARHNELVEDERYGLTQLVLMLPYETSYAQRLQEINQLHGFVEVPLDVQPPVLEESQEAEPAVFESHNFADPAQMYEFSTENPVSSNGNNNGEVVDYSQYIPEATNGNGSYEESKDFAFTEDLPQAEIVETEVASSQPEEANITKTELDQFEKAHFEQELESIQFYITQGYRDLAIESLDSLERELGTRPEIEKFRRLLNPTSDEISENTAETAEPEPETITPVVPVESSSNGSKGFDILDEFRSELDLEEIVKAPDDGDDFETHYQLGIAYKEMGLMEDSIREFQEAVKMVNANDGTRRFFLSCNLLGHCFMEKEMPNLAVMWYKRCLETANLNAEEKHGLCYEVANAYEAGNDIQKAIEYFEKIYMENVDYRDVSERLDGLREN